MGSASIPHHQTVSNNICNYKHNISQHKFLSLSCTNRGGACIPKRIGSGLAAVPRRSVPQEGLHDTGLIPSILILYQFVSYVDYCTLYVQIYIYIYMYIYTVVSQCWPSDIFGTMGQHLFAMVENVPLCMVQSNKVHCSTVYAWPVIRKSNTQHDTLLSKSPATRVSQNPSCPIEK